MAHLKFSGPFRHRVRSFLALNRIALGVYGRHLMGRKIADDWNAHLEIGIRFWRHQFTVAMNHSDIKTGRAIYNSLQTLTDDVYEVEQSVSNEPHGIWFEPKTIKNDKTLLYFHGGGYTFGGPTAERYAAMLAHHTGSRLFMPFYRLTPEHPHPAQADDALDAWQALRKSTKADDLVLIGDSAGGHMVLFLLQTLKQRDEQQPALCIALCPWTDIGDRGDSLTVNNHYDIVQGWMALRFGEWLDPDGHNGREALSPIEYDYTGLAPIYIQVGGRDVLRDMIVDFADVQSENGADIMLDLWNDMPHNFQVYDSLRSSSSQALSRIARILSSSSSATLPLESLPGVTRITKDNSG